MEEIHSDKMTRDIERRNRKEREERGRSRSRSRQGRPEQQFRGEEERRRCKLVTAWNPPSDEGALVMAVSSKIICL